jgi:hypothetical protein
MALSAVVHLVGEDAFLADLDQMPDPTHTFVVCRNMRKKDGKPLAFLTDGATAYLYAWSRITFIELMGEVPGVLTAARPTTTQGTTVLGFFRDDES